MILWINKLIYKSENQHHRINIFRVMEKHRAKEYKGGGQVFKFKAPYFMPRVHMVWCEILKQSLPYSHVICSHSNSWMFPPSFLGIIYTFLKNKEHITQHFYPYVYLRVSKSHPQTKTFRFYYNRLYPYSSLNCYCIFVYYCIFDDFCKIK